MTKKRERQKILREEALAAREEEAAPGVDVTENPTPLLDTALDKLEKVDGDPKNFGLVTELDIESDNAALQKLTSLVEERYDVHG